MIKGIFGHSTVNDFWGKISSNKREKAEDYAKKIENLNVEATIIRRKLKNFED